MKKKAVALIDCNSFYASCEQAFDAHLTRKPVIVLSNNDGCIVALTQEAKQFGLKRGQPAFQSKEIIKRHNVQVFSSNYSLYADMSARVMSVLRQFSPRVEVYSIDEAWLDLSDRESGDLAEYGRAIKARIWQYVGLPVSVAVAPTKCLAKVAMEAVKHDEAYDGVLDITRSPEQALDILLDQVAIEDVWGIGSKYTLFLNNYGILTAKHLRDADQKWVRRYLTVVGERIVLELRGIPCLPVEPGPAPPRQEIMCSKTFGRDITSLDELTEAVATYTARAAEKLRQQDSLAGAMTVFIRTNSFKADEPQYSNSFSLHLPYATSFTPDLIDQALRALAAMYRDGYRYKKAGVYLHKITPRDAVQPDLFGEYSIDAHQKQGRLMLIIDAINRVYGRDTLFFAVQGVERAWAMRRSYLSARYTTQWSEILQV